MKQTDSLTVMDHMLVVFVLFWSSGLQAEENDHFEGVRLEGGSSSCSGILQVKQEGVWRNVADLVWNLKLANVICRQLNCGSVVEVHSEFTDQPPWNIRNSCLQSESRLKKCLTKRTSSPDSCLKIICSDNVRLVNGTSLCSGRLELKFSQSWSTVCEDNFDLKDAEVVCRELSCGPRLVLQGMVYGVVDAPTCSKEFQCDGNERTLLECGSSGLTGDTCPPGKAVGLTCSEPDNVQLIGGSSRCSGELVVKQQGTWKRVDGSMSEWNLRTADAVCQHLDCGSALSTGIRQHESRPVWSIIPTCLQSKTAVRECFMTVFHYSNYNLEITCSESVRLIDGKSLCSGRLEVSFNQLWSSVCADEFDFQDAEVVCRELGCGAPLVLEEMFYGAEDASMWSKEFHCKGSESALLDCGSSGSARDTCSPGNAVGLTCSEPNDVQLVGGTSRCAGRFEMQHNGQWRPVAGYYYHHQWDLMSSGVLCKQLNCGSALTTGTGNGLCNTDRGVWIISSSCDQSKSAVRECSNLWSEPECNNVEVTCSDSIRLVNGKSRCSGRLEVKSNQLWSSVCENDFDLQDAEVVCRELGCGAPSVLKGGLYGEAEAAVWSEKFHCEGRESVLLDCGSSDSSRDICSPIKAVGLTCSEPDNVRLSGGTNRCDGTLEMKKNGEWRPVRDNTFEWYQKEASVVCQHLNCGVAVSAASGWGSSSRPVWHFRHPCGPSDSFLAECLIPSNFNSPLIVEVICSGILAQPDISFFSNDDAVSVAEQHWIQVLTGSNFTIGCSILPQYPGGFFQLTLTTSTTSQNYTLPAVNHSAHFLFFTANLGHQGNYKCVYYVYIFSHNFSSESQPLHLSVSGSLTDLAIRVFFVMSMVFSAALIFYYKATREQNPNQENNIELENLDGADLEEEGAARHQNSFQNSCNLQNHV